MTKPRLLSDAQKDMIRRMNPVDDVLRRFGVAVERASGGRQRCRCPLHGEKTPSFYVFEDRRSWHCFGCHQGGDVFRLVMLQAGCDFPGAVDYLGGVREFTKEEDAAIRDRIAKEEARQQAEREKREKEGIAIAQRIWRGAVAAKGTPVETYLEYRGIDLAKIGGVPRSLRFARLGHPETGKAVHPAMVAAIQGADGCIQGIHRTYLLENGRGKLAGVPAKLSLGVVTGGAVRFGPARPLIRDGEGIETSLSVLQADPDFDGSVWCSISLGNMGPLDLPPVVKRREVLLDNDMSEKGLEAQKRAMHEAIAAANARGYEIVFYRPPQGMDFNDLLAKPDRGRAHG